MFLTIAVVVLIILLVAFSSGDSKHKKKLKERESAKQKVEQAFFESSITERHKNILLNRLETNLVYRIGIENEIQSFASLKKYEESLIEKYGTDTGNRLINHEYWIGMTEEQLVDCKGRPDKIEKEVLKTKTKITYIYGNKNSGDYFVLENDTVTKIVDR